MTKKKLMITDDSFKAYSKDLGKCKQMTAKREREIRKMMIDPNTTEQQKKQLKDEMVKGYLKYVISEASKLRYTGLDMVDLIGEGNYGLMKAIDDFDWNKGLKFTTYAYHWIRAQMMISIYNDARTIRLPTNIAQELHRQVKNLNENNVELDGTMSNLPSTIDLFKSINSDDEDSTLLDVVQNDNASIPDEAFSMRDFISKLISKLDEREQKVIKLSFGLDGRELDIKEIAVEMDLHKESVRLIRLKALEKMGL